MSCLLLLCSFMWLLVFMKFFRLTAQLCGKRCVQFSPSGTRLMAEAFFSQIISGVEMWIHHLELQTKRQSLEWHHTPSWKKNFKATPWAGKSWPPFLGCRRFDFDRHYAVWSNHWLRCVHSNSWKLAEALLENLTSTKMLLKSSFNMAAHSHTQIWKHGKQSLFYPAHHIAQILLPQVSISLEPLKAPSVRKDWGVMMSLLKKWRSGCKYRS